LIREEIDLPDDAGHSDVVELLTRVRELQEAAQSGGFQKEVETLQKLTKRLTARIVPEQVSKLNIELATKMLAIGIEIDKVNKARARLYGDAQKLMLQASDSGMSQSDIARLLGVDRATVRNSTTKVITGLSRNGKNTLKRVKMTYQEYLDDSETSNPPESTNP